MHVVDDTYERAASYTFLSCLRWRPVSGANRKAILRTETGRKEGREEGRELHLSTIYRHRSAHYVCALLYLKLDITFNPHITWSSRR